MSRTSALQPGSIAAALRPCLPQFIAGLAFSGAVNILYLSSPLYMLQVYNRVLSSGSLYTLAALTLALALALLTLGALEALRGRVLVRTSLRVDYEMAEPVQRALMRRAARSGAERQILVLRDVDHVRQALAGPALAALFDIPWIPVYMGVLALLHPLLGLVALVGGLLLGVLAALNEALTRQTLTAANDAASRGYAASDRMLRNAEAVAAMGMEEGLIRRWRQDRVRMLSNQAHASDRAGVLSAVIKVTRLLLQGLILGVGAWLVIEREITPGAMFAGSLLLGRALAPVEQLVGSWKGVVSARQSARRINELLRGEPAPAPTMRLPAPDGHLAVEAVEVRVPGRDQPLLQDVSFRVEPGQVAVLVGPSAAGKSTLARLLVGVQTPTNGTVRLDDADVARWGRDDFGRHVGYLPQTIDLFAGSVRDNIARFSDADPAQVLAAAGQAGIHEMILRLPQGYETEIGENGLLLSGGQRQRLGLARALLGSPRLLVLDEPDANLDAAGERGLADVLRGLRQAGHTLVLITHRPRLLSLADQIVTLDAGRVARIEHRTAMAAE